MYQNIVRARKDTPMDWSIEDAMSESHVIDAELRANGWYGLCVENDAAG